MPFNIRVHTSSALRRSDVIKQKGEPNEIGDYNELSYIIYHKKNNVREFFFFNRKTDVLWHTWTCDGIFSLSDFEDIEINFSTEKDVLKIDKFLVLVFTEEDQAISEHFISNGSSLIIEYRLIDEKWTVAKKDLIENEPSNTSIFIDNYFNKTNN